MRWAVYEAGKTHARASAPDHAYYAQVKDRCNGKRAALSEARKRRGPSPARCGRSRGSLHQAHALRARSRRVPQMSPNRHEQSTAALSSNL